jgi:hypothetical protein
MGILDCFRFERGMLRWWEMQRKRITHCWCVCRAAVFYESRHVFAFAALSLFNITVFFLILGVCRQISTETEDIEAEIPMKGGEGVFLRCQGHQPTVPFGILSFLMS